MPKQTPEEIAQMILDSAYGDESEIEGLSDEEEGTVFIKIFAFYRTGVPNDANLLMFTQ